MPGASVRSAATRAKMRGSSKRFSRYLEAIKGDMGVHVFTGSCLMGGQRLSRKRVARLMQEADLSARRKQRRVQTTKRDKAHPVALNLLNREFQASHPNKKWVPDITYIPTAQGWLYLAVVLDLYSRMVVGWSMSSNC